MTMNQSLRRALSLAAFLFLLSPAGNAQSAFATAPRISGRVDDNVRTRVQGSLTSAARKEYDQGEADSGTQLTHMRLVLHRTEEQRIAFETYLAQLQDKSSPNYHKWLTPEQIGQLYGPADSDVTAAVAWLESHGFKVEPVSPAHTNIAFSGTVGQAEEAFRTQIHSFSKNGQQFYANITEPSIPTALTAVVKGIAHLNTLQPRSFAHKSTVGTYDPEQKRNVVANSSIKATPELTSGDGFLYIVPGDAATIYDTPNSTFNAKFSGSTSYTGAGVTIGIGGDSAIQTSTIVNYRTKYLGDSNSSKLLYTNVDGITENSDELEAYLDNEVSGGIAPGATLHFYTSSDLISGIDQALTENTVDIFSLSFGACEFFLPTVDNQLLYSYWQNAAAQGIAVTVSTGDSGSAGCDATTDSNGNNVTDAVEGLQVNGFASTPYNIAVGGTDFAGLPGHISTYAPTTSSSNFYRSAVSYIPESTWNDSTNLNSTIAKNTPMTGASANIVAGSGGQSSCSTNTDTNSTLGSCTNGYSKPVWQRGSGMSSDGVRDLPDVSLMAGDGVDDAAWLVCSDDQGTVSGVTVTANCATQSDGNYYFIGVGGTSAAAPAFAGMLALLQQKTGGRLGQAGIELYDLYNASHNSAIFHDITSGNNAVPCTVNSPNCSKNSKGYYFESGYDTSTGYDLATGMGSVDASQLINYWGTAVGVSTATVTVQPGATSITPAQSLTVAVNVTGTYVGPSGSAEKPTGTVTLTGGSYSSGAQTLSNGTFSFTVPAGQLAIGSDTLSAAYSGDPVYATATGTASVTVVAPIATLSPTTLTFGNVMQGLTSSSQPVTLKNTGNAALTISGVSITGSGSSAFAQTNNCGASLAASASCTINVTFMPGSATAFTASLAVADNASGSPQTVALTGTGTPPMPAVTLNPTSLSLSAAVGATASGTVTLTNSGAAALAITSIAATGTNASAFTVDSSGCAATLAASAHCTINITFNASSVGSFSASLTVTDNASGSPQSVALTGTGSEPSGAAYTLSAASVTVTAGSSSGNTSAITATGTGGFVGPDTVTISSCTLATSPTGATNAPTCAITTAAVTFAAGSGSGSGGVVTISTTAASSSVRTAASNNKAPWLGGVGAVAIAGLLLFIPGSMRKWRALLGAFLLVATLGVLSGCGGGSSNNGGSSNPGTTKGSYTFTVSGKDSVSGASQSATLNLTVN